MGKSLIITEKSSVAKEIASVLQINVNNKGGYFEDGQYIISWAAGHLLTLGYPGDQNPDWEEYSVDTLPIFTELKEFPISSTSSQLNVLVKLIDRPDVDEIINAGDAGIEGEGIQWEIYNYAFAKTGKRKKVRRLWISSISRQAIMEGFENLEPEDSRRSLYNAFLARRNGDWFYGMNMSRFFGLTYNARGLSIGSVKNQILGMVVRRCQEIRSFVPEPFYQVAVRVNDSFDVGWIGTDGSRLEKRTEAEEIGKKVSGQKGTVTFYETKKKQQEPPVLYNLTKLQSDAVKQYGITSDQTLEILQSLYLDYKIITYPRTDSEFITLDDVQNIKPLIESIADSAFVKELDFSISQMASRLLENGLMIDQIVNDEKVNDHPGLLINENFADFNGDLKRNEKAVLGMILKRMLVSLSEPYIYSETTIQLECNGEEFGCSRRTPVHMGYKVIASRLAHQKPNGKENAEGECPLPALEEGDEVTITAVEILDKMTRAPQHFNESTLFSAMEKKDKCGIGTSATRAAIFKELLDKKYLYKDKSISRKLPYILPTDLGEKIYTILPPDMTTPELAARWQHMLNQIEEGKMTYEYYMNEMQDFITDKIKNYEKIEGVGLETEAAKASTKQMKLAKSISLTLGIPLPADQTIHALSAYINANMPEYLSASTKKYEEQDSYILGKCPLCGGNVNVAKSGTSYYCANYKKGCKFSVMKNDYTFKRITGKEMTKAVIKNLLEKGSARCNGKTITVKWNTGTSPKGFMMHTFSGK